MSYSESDESDTVPNSLNKRVSSFADLIRAGDGIHSVRGICGFIRSVVLRINDLMTRYSLGFDWIFRDADFQFILQNIFRMSSENPTFDLANTPRVEYLFTLGLRRTWTPSDMVFKSLKNFINSSKLDHLSLYNVQGLQKGILSQSNVKHIVLYQARAASIDSSIVEDLDSITNSEGEEKRLRICPLESLETDMNMTLAEQVSLFHSRPHTSSVGHHLPGEAIFPYLTKLRLHCKRIHTSEFNIAANEILLNAPALEDLFIYNGDKLPTSYWPEHSVLPLRYSHLTRLRSFSLGTYIPIYKQIEILQCLCADDPPPSLSEIIMEAMIDLRYGLLRGIKDAVRYIQWLSLDKLDMFLRRTGFERVKKVVVRLGMAMDIYEPEDLDKEVTEGFVILWRTTIRDAVTRQLEMKAVEVNVELEL
ncbi:hypothetical protein JR316_0004025 [Psilocybe cubensis]|uniref:Uncharacterized protein n=2 Tax=Psilocybe cubensis TaxID=181762 RepID=A0A8H7Y6B0_PSICU|nr:hypothetical protein JR316_0004025 [Psilocybe cubensis]KAH9484543.1 hypothetical protein JR316_0004025 [Psilocybe cubensis]